MARSDPQRQPSWARRPLTKAECDQIAAERPNPVGKVLRPSDRADLAYALNRCFGERRS